jgi:starvation-inducible DNA-binding protein
MQPDPLIPVNKDNKTQGQLLQSCVTASIDLALALKQLHWNIRGSQFQPVHEFLDEIIDHARSTSDILAERMVTLGVPAIGQRTSLADSPIQKVEDSFVKDTAVLEQTGNALDATIRVLREAQEALGEIDAVTEDHVIAALQDYEKDLWMIRSHLR